MAKTSLKKEVLDTNVLLRFLVGDNQSQQKRAAEWFREAEEGRRKITVIPLVIAEACFVLESFYKKPRKEIVQAMEVFVGQRWLQVEERGALVKLWPYYLKNLHFVDSFLLAWCEVHETKLLTFDRQLDNIS
ncbi:MAG TPA: PIN domain-containing protein [Candidatus Paceibacterota bacterium]